MVTDEYFVKIPRVHGRKYWQHSLLASLSSSEWLNQALPKMSEDFVFSDLFDFFETWKFLSCFPWSQFPVDWWSSVSSYQSPALAPQVTPLTRPMRDPHHAPLTNQKAAPYRHQITDLTPPQLPGQLLLSKFPSGNFSPFRIIACTNLVPPRARKSKEILVLVFVLYPSNILRYLLLKVVVCSVYIFLIHQMSDLFSSWV